VIMTDGSWGQFILTDFALEKGRWAGHTRRMEKTIALAVVVAIIAFVAIYSLFSLRGRK
jgi:hypothetical protein